MNDVNGALVIWRINSNGSKTKHVSHFISFEAAGFTRNAHILTFVQQFLNLLQWSSAFWTSISDAETSVKALVKITFSANAETNSCPSGVFSLLLFWRDPFNDPDWNETMGWRCELTGRCDAAQRLPALERSNKRQKMSTNREHKCNTTRNQRELITLTC